MLVTPALALARGASVSLTRSRSFPISGSLSLSLSPSISACPPSSSLRVRVWQKWTVRQIGERQSEDSDSVSFWFAVLRERLCVSLI